jgi:hypothetical protein
MQIQTKLAIPADEIAVNIANNTNTHHRIDIHHHRGIVSLFWNQKNISIPHLIKAQRANIQTINFHTKLASFAHMSKIQRITASIHIINKNEMYCCF